MKRSALLLAILLCCTAAFANDTPRPRIFGIASVQILVTDLADARSFYTKVLGQARDCKWCEQVPGSAFLINQSQAISISTAPSPAPSNLIEEIAFATDNVPKLRRYLVSHSIGVSKANKPIDNYLSVADPEGHRIGFLQGPPEPAPTQIAALEGMFPLRLRIIHAGFVVRDREAEDKFYKDILGFHVYWHGGRKDDETSWVDMQVPEGTDWIEYMLNVSPSASHKTLGVMNHVAIGVADIKSETTRLRDEENLVPILEEPKIGRDGKWQLNLYDPDLTRIEFMEFTPVQKPCCSEFTGPHPKAPAKP